MTLMTKIWEGFGLTRDSVTLAVVKWIGFCVAASPIAVDFQKAGAPLWFIHLVQFTALAASVSAAQHRTSDLPGAPKGTVSSGTLDKIAGSVSVVLLAVLLGASIAGCAGARTPIAAIAQPSVQVEQTGDALLKAAQAAHALTNPLTGQPFITTAQLDVVALAGDKLGRVGSTLARTLSDYQAAKAAGRDTTVLAAAIRALVDDATAALQTIGRKIPAGTVQTIDQAVTDALSMYAQIRASAL